MLTYGALGTSTASMCCPSAVAVKYRLNPPEGRWMREGRDEGGGERGRERERETGREGGRGGWKLTGMHR